MRALHPAWFQEDLERLFGMLDATIRPRVAKRISFEEIPQAHSRVEQGGLQGKLVLCPDLPSPGGRVPPRRESGATSKEGHAPNHDRAS
jgi:NADPH:quinone reductase